MIATATADVVLQALAYNDSFEVATLYGPLAMGGRGGVSYSGARQPTNRLTSEQSAACIQVWMTERLYGRP